MPGAIQARLTRALVVGQPLDTFELYRAAPNTDSGNVRRAAYQVAEVVGRKRGKVGRPVNLWKLPSRYVPRDKGATRPRARGK